MREVAALGEGLNERFHRSFPIDLAQSADKGMVRIIQYGRPRSARSGPWRARNARHREAPASDPAPGGTGKFFRIEVRPGTRFARYRLQTVGRPGHTKRLAGRTADGNWATRSWLVAKTDAHRDGKTLVIDDARTKTAIEKAVRGPIRHFKGDIFHARPRRDIPEREKPTPAMRRAQRENIKKAQRAWRRLHGK